MSLDSRFRPYLHYVRTLLTYYTESQRPILSYWWKGEKNVGDLMGPFLLRKMFERRVIHADDMPFLPRGRRVSVTIGSILQQVSFRRPHIWGTGIINPDRVPDLDDPKIHSVRGPRTREALLRNGYDCPERYGDLGLLIGRYADLNESIGENATNGDKIGLVLHHSDADLASNFKDAPEHLRMITVRSEVPAFVARVNSCRLVLSSSLHGIITAHALGIPAVWLRRVDNKKGGAFKYHDYLESLGSKVEYLDIGNYSSITSLLDRSEEKALPPPPSSFIDEIESSVPVMRKTLLA